MRTLFCFDCRATQSDGMEGDVCPNCRKAQLVSVDIAPVGRAVETIDFDLGLSELQQEVQAGWTLADYSVAFVQNELESRDFAHALLHIGKATGALWGVVDNLDHGAPLELTAKQVQQKMADIIISVARMENTLPELLRWPGWEETPLTMLAREVTDRLARLRPHYGVLAVPLAEAEAAYEAGRDIREFTEGVDDEEV
jgi:hypothetical protein